MVKDLRNCRAVVVDVSAPTNLIVALMEYFDPTGDILMVVASTQVYTALAIVLSSYLLFN